MIGRDLGGFEILEEIGRGGMGVVYRARQTSLNKVVALKALPKPYASDPRARKRFTTEAQNMARLSHPNIVDVIDVGEEDDVPYFAMQYVEGETLASLIQREGALPAERAAELGAQIAEALGHAHDRDVIHRDVKPGNILIDEHGRAVVTDFGIAKTVEGTGLTTEGMVIGVPEYMSPEIARGNPIDGRSDIYSLGVVLYQMVTGRVPFSATTPVATVTKHVSELPLPPSAVGAKCPEWLEGIILRALAKEPADRFFSGQEMAAALRAATPVARPTTEFVRTGGTAPPAAVPAQPPARAPIVRIAWLLGVLGAALMMFACGVWVANTLGSSGGLVRPVGGPGSGPGIGESGDDLEEGQPQPPEPPGPVPISVPDVRRDELDDARETLRAAGLAVLVRDEEAYDENVPEGDVVSQDPDPREEVQPGTEVSLTLSRGPKPRVPDVVGRTETDARRELEQMGFNVIANRPRWSTRHGPGVIKKQSPSDGTKQERGDVVYIVPSRGLGSTEDFIIGRWKRLTRNYKRERTGKYEFWEDGRAAYYERGSEDHRWQLGTDHQGEYVLFRTTGNSYYVSFEDDGDKMVWNGRQTTLNVKETSFQRTP